MKFKKPRKQLLSVILVMALILSLVACGEVPPIAILSDSNSQISVEAIEQERFFAEAIEIESSYIECITEEVYLKELIEAENKITELLLEEESISEVVECKAIYVSQDHIEEFANNSQIANLFGEGLDLSPVFKKVAVGTGVIVTLVIVKKVNLPEPIASIVCSAADNSLEFSEKGAVIGSLLGGLTGAANQIDESGRASAVIGFSLAVAGFVITTVSLINAIPTGGGTAISAAAGIKMIVAGIGVVKTATATIKSGVNAIKVFTTTDGTDIDWSDIDWDAVGVSAAQKAINNGADGYMWGSIVGAIYGGADGYEYYHKFNTPYTDYNTRLMQTPKDGNNGKWSGKRGESDFILDEPIICPDGTKIVKVTYKNAVPDFSSYQYAQVKISNMTDKRLGDGFNYNQADTILAKYWTKINFAGKKWSVLDVEAYRKKNGLSWHEMSNMEYMQLLPYEVNRIFTHCGGVAEYKAMIGRGGVGGFD